LSYGGIERTGTILRIQRACVKFSDLYCAPTVFQAARSARNSWNSSFSRLLRFWGSTASTSTYRSPC